MALADKLFECDHFLGLALTGVIYFVSLLKRVTKRFIVIIRISRFFTQIELQHGFHFNFTCFLATQRPNLGPVMGQHHSTVYISVYFCLIWPDPSGIYLFKVNNGNIVTMCEICSKLIIKIPERSHWLRSDVLIVIS